MTAPVDLALDDHLGPDFADFADKIHNAFGQVSDCSSRAVQSGRIDDDRGNMGLGCGRSRSGNEMSGSCITFSGITRSAIHV